MTDLQGFFRDSKMRFVLWFTGVFVVSFFLLYITGLVPSELLGGGSALQDLKIQAIEDASGVQNNNTENSSAPTTTPKNIGEKPVHIYATKVDINVIVENPTSKDNAVLNEYLTKGAVRYPESAFLGAGNTLIFGHSSNLSVVNNQAYKAFNGVSKLVRGDKIYVDSADHRYVYTVSKVSMVKANDEYVSFDNTKNMLTLSTCNTLGAHEDRYVAEAVLDETIAL